MPYQQQIGLTIAPAVAGDKATLNPVVYTVGNPLAEGPVTVGTFVWAGSTPQQAKNSGSGPPVGLVERWLAYVDDSLASGGTLTVPEGSALQVARRGDYFVTGKSSSTPGQKVFATLADGSIRTGEAGATVEGAVETAWSVVSGGAAGDLIIISNWS